MSRQPTWIGEDSDVGPLNLGLLDWLRALWRGGVLGAVTFGMLAVLLLVRLVERPVFGAHRPWTPAITQFVCRTAFRILGMGFHSHGEPMAHPGAVVANHSSWLDIFALNARARVYFVSKSEVANWPGIGWLARANGTVFIRRNARDAAAQRAVFEDRLAVGHKLLFFPEGTSTDGLRVLPFKPTLFAAFFANGLRETSWVQPVTVVYTAPERADPKFYGWWGEMDFGRHFLKTLATPRQGRVDVYWSTPLRVADFEDRKALAARSEADVRAFHPGGQTLQGEGKTAKAE